MNSRSGSTGAADQARAHAKRGPIDRAAAGLCIAVIWAYRVTLSPLLGGQCRFHPTCSRYALDAYREHAVPRATRLVIARLARCHPFSRGGYDPVPPDERNSRAA